MGIVRFALKFPHTFFVLAALILVLGVSAIVSMPTDIFPEINIPVVTVIWQETGLSTPEMEQRVTTYSQYSISTSVNGIRDIEAQTLNGISIQKLYFQPDVDIDLAIAQIVAATNSIRALMPPGIQPPTIVRYDPSSVPVLQISLSSDTLRRPALRLRHLPDAPAARADSRRNAADPGRGKYRQIMVDIDPLKLQAKGLTPNDVVNAVNAQAFTVPSGTAKLGDKQYTVRTNALPSTIDDLNNIPIKFHQRDGVHQGCGAGSRRLAGPAERRSHEGKQSVLLSIIKNGNASTLAVVNAVKEALKTARAAAPSGMQIRRCLISRSSSRTRSSDC
jgi:multidrug efflux pump subunit AcrB